MGSQAQRRHTIVVVVFAAAMVACERIHPDRNNAPEADAADDARQIEALPPVDASPPADDVLPPAESEELPARAQHLLEAIAKDDSNLAMDMLFPRDAWLASRDVSDPGKEWERRVAKPFRRGLHALARRHSNPDRAQFVSFELGRAISQETPRRHAWKKPLWAVRESRLTFIAGGRTRTIRIREMVAWRGAWYVTHLR
jgi:hypothetical protein